METVNLACFGETAIEDMYSSKLLENGVFAGAEARREDYFVSGKMQIVHLHLTNLVSGDEIIGESSFLNTCILNC